MIILWVLNGFFQSMLWGPMTKTITHWIPPKKRSFASIAISTSGVGGTLLTLLLAGQIIESLNWRWVFIIPGIIILLFSFVWYIFMRNHPSDVGLSLNNTDNSSNASKSNKAHRSYTLWEVINKSRLWFVIIACFVQGIVKDGINLWAPTFFMETHHLNIKSVTSLVIVIPLMNFGGIVLSGWLNKVFKYKEKITVAILFTIGILMILGLNTLGSKSTFIGIICLGLSSAMMSGSNAILLGIIPMKFDKYNKVSAIAGTLDFCSYFISGFAALITGSIVDLIGWSGVLIFWIAVTVIGTIALVFSHLLENDMISKKDNKIQAEL